MESGVLWLAHSSHGVMDYIHTYILDIESLLLQCMHILPCTVLRLIVLTAMHTNARVSDLQFHVGHDMI